MFLVLLAGAAAATFATFWITSPTHRIDRSGYDQIQMGFTQQAVEDILRVPPGDHGVAALHGHEIQEEEYAEGITTLDPATHREWLGEAVGIITISDEQGGVAVKYLVKVNRGQVSLLSRIRQMLGL